MVYIYILFYISSQWTAQPPDIDNPGGEQGNLELLEGCPAGPAGMVLRPGGWPWGLGAAQWDPGNGPAHWTPMNPRRGATIKTGVGPRLAQSARREM